MISIYDNDTLAAALALPLDRTLAAILRDRWVQAVAAGLQDHSNLIVIQAGDEMADVEQEIGFRPTSNPVDGAQYGSPKFQPFWPWLTDLGQHYEMIVTVGTDYAVTLLIEKAEGVPLSLLEMCKRYTGEP